MDIYSGKIIKIEQKIGDEKLFIYRVYGLNIFSSNYQIPKEFVDIESVPMAEFLEGLVQEKYIYCLIGYPALDNWMNDEFEQINIDISIFDFLKMIDFEKVSISYYGGVFKRFENNRESILFRISDCELLRKVLDVFTIWDSVVFFICHRAIDSVRLLSRMLETENAEGMKFVRDIVSSVKLLVVTKDEGLYFEIYSQNKIESFFSEAVNKSESYVIKSDWYKENKSNLVWDDEIEHCLIVRPA